jgi:hypothetical protein
MFTQPLMYKKIRTHKNSHQRYVERLLEEGSLSKAQVRWNGTCCFHMVCLGLRMMQLMCCMSYFWRAASAMRRCGMGLWFWYSL